MKSLVGLGNTKIPDGLQRLDMLTREESGMAVARNLEIIHEVDCSVNAARELIQDVDGDMQVLKGNVKVIEEVTRSVDQNVKIIVDGTQFFLPSPCTC